MDIEKVGKSIAIGLVLFVGVQVYSFLMTNEKTTDSELDKSIRLIDSDEEAAQLRDEVDSLYNEAMEDAYINESDSAKAERFGQKFGKNIDDDLLELGIVDSNYKYKDLDFANKYFELITINLQKILPDTSDGITSKEAELTHYYNTYTYVIEEFLPPESVEAIRATSQSQEYIQRQCDVFYASKYQRANRTSVSIKVYDLSGDLISKVLLDESRCD